MKLAVGSMTTQAFYLQARSLYDLIELAASSVEVPPEHATLGFSDPALDGLLPLRGLLTIQGSQYRPSIAVLVAVRHRGYWF